jgi:hypothetical protein
MYDGSIQLYLLHVSLGAPPKTICCTSPGGWLQVAQKALPVSSLIIGIDLAPIRAIRGVRTIVGDITTQKARQVGCLSPLALTTGCPWLLSQPARAHGGLPSMLQGGKHLSTAAYLHTRQPCFST